MSESASGSTAGTSSSARDLRLHPGGRGAGRRAVPAPDRAATAAGVPVRRLLGSMDTFKDKQILEALHAGAGALAGVEPGGINPAEDGACWRSAAGRRSRLLCLGAHCDDIEIGCGGTLLRLLGEETDVEVRLGGARRRDERGARRAKAASACSTRAGASGRSRDSASGYLPVGCGGQGVLRAASGAPSPTLSYPLRATPPGSPAGLRARGTPSATIRSSSTRSRSTTATWAAQRLRAIFGDTGEAKIEPRWTSFPTPARPAVVHGGDVPCSPALPRRRVQRAGRLRGSFHAGSWCSHEDRGHRHRGVPRLPAGRQLMAEGTRSSASTPATTAPGGSTAAYANPPR